jgi:hypothetical protein
MDRTKLGLGRGLFEEAIHVRVRVRIRTRSFLRCISWARALRCSWAYSLLEDAMSSYLRVMWHSG